MDCLKFSRQLEAWLDGGLSPAQAGEQSAHAERCRGCAAEVSEERALRAALRHLPAPAPRPGFAAEALRVATLAERASARARPGRVWLPAIAGAMAASLCIAIGLWVRAPESPANAQASAGRVSTQESLQSLVLTVGKAESLRLRIEAPRDFDDVRFSVDLPDHVSLVGQPGVRAMTWQGALRKGDNVLELPLLAEHGASGRMLARVSWGSFEHRIEASLVSAPAEPGSVGT